jgi:hypothetical protein
VVPEAADCAGIVNHFPTDLPAAELGDKSLAFGAGFPLCPMEPFAYAHRAKGFPDSGSAGLDDLNPPNASAALV